MPSVSACAKSPVRSFWASFPLSILKEFKMLLSTALASQDCRWRFIQFEADRTPSKLTCCSVIWLCCINL